MQQRILGPSGLSTAPLVFGGNVFGWTADRETSFRLLDAFVDAGFNAIDTADAYSRWVPGHDGGESETIIGEWLKARGRHNDVLILTKVGSDMGQGHNDLSAAWIERAVEESLRRLQTDVIDLYQAHWPDPRTPQQETLRAFDRLVQAGKVRAIGVSNHDAAQTAEALAISEREGLAAYATLQPHYNLYSRDTFEGPLQDLAVERGLGVITYFSLEAGFLTGKYQSADQVAGTAREGMLIDKFDERGLRILAALKAVADRNEATPAQVSLAWLLTRPAVTAPIVSATSVDQLADTLKAASLTLSDDDLAELTEASED
ncbi:aldo/keto reductase [Brevundimonas sp. S30B]|uniref:aldo/keto reductase n=1 Tax=unclassified Brevundimonas TaxID=2622653 RepID=UPI001071CFCB|nr:MULTISPECIES: aldo/keto reductase [unclassified Brevundimonas]QBX36966.1 aldo/keto reductase [Brevundimonas sp. MF30-B]TFW04239.1 aldo/keto reductase [Brevundimonas sp. S30B]